MCSVKQWRAYQAAESMVSTEVDEVRAEADEIEPGWSQVRFFFLQLITAYETIFLFYPNSLSIPVPPSHTLSLFLTNKQQQHPFS
jgi:hypothetical protein